MKLIVFINSVKFCKLLSDNYRESLSFEVKTKNHLDAIVTKNSYLTQSEFLSYNSDIDLVRCNISELDWNKSEILFFNDDYVTTLKNNSFDFEFKVLYHTITKNNYEGDLNGLITNQKCKGSSPSMEEKHENGAETLYYELAKAMESKNQDEIKKILSQIGIDEELEKELNEAFDVLYDQNNYNYETKSTKINDSFLKAKLSID